METCCYIEDRGGSPGPVDTFQEKAALGRFAPVAGQRSSRFGIGGKDGPATPLLGIHTKETEIERDTCTLMFITALFIIARTWKQPRCPSTDEWIRKLWYIYTMDYLVQFSSVAQSCPTLCDPMNRSTPGLPVHHQLPEFTQTHVHRVRDPSQPSISSSVVPFSSCPQSLPASKSSPMSQLFA